MIAVAVVDHRDDDGYGQDEQVQNVVHKCADNVGAMIDALGFNLLPSLMTICASN